jgi:voltage-gated potassium channel Kch
MGAEHACATIITIDKAPITEQLVYLIHKRYPKMPIYARGRNKEHCKKLQKAGASMPVSETLEVSLKLGGAALSIVGTPSEEVSRILQDYREIYYEDEPEYTKPY